MQKSHSGVSTYFITLSLIGLALSIFYSFYLKYYGGIYFTHYYEYYTRAVVITDSLKRLDFLSALRYYFQSFVNKILIFRSVPFLLLFGQSQFVFLYSNVLFNLFLLLILFHSLLKIMQPEEAFSFTLFILSQYFFIEQLASYYIDLSLFLACSIFFIYLSLFDKNFRKYNIRLIFIVFLLLLIKNISYALVAVVGISLIIYFLISKNKKWVYVLRLTIILAAGFFVYYMVLGCSKDLLLKDLHPAMPKNLPLLLIGKKLTLISAASRIIKLFGQLQPFGNHYFVDKFPPFWFNILIYPVVLFVAYKRRDKFWILLFFASEFLLIFFFSIKGIMFDRRYFLPFYFIYLYFAYEFIILTVGKISPKGSINKFLVLISLIIFLTSFVRLTDPETRLVYAGRHYCEDFFSRYLARRSKLYIDDDSYFYFYASQLDSDKRDYSYLSGVDPRFKYKIVKDVKNADYVIGKNPLKVDRKEYYELITTAGNYYLLKIK